MTGRELFRFIRKSLSDGGFADTASFEANCLMKDCCGLDIARAALEDKPILKEQFEQIKKKLKRRLAGEPLQYVLGEWDFLGLPFYLDRGVLIPRADTEILALRLIKKFRDTNGCRILDIGSGSGAIAVSAAFFIAKAKITALDISPLALALTAKNAQRHGVGDRVKTLEGDLLKGLNFETPFDAVVSNPPYIPTKEIMSLDPSVRDFEPVNALDGGPDGLCYYRALAKYAPACLKKGGSILVETGAGQAYEVSAILEAAGFGQIEILKDLSGIERVVEGQLL